MIQIQTAFYYRCKWNNHDWISARWNTTCTECEERKHHQQQDDVPKIDSILVLGLNRKHSQQLQRIKTTCHRFFFLPLEVVKREYLVVVYSTPAMFIFGATSQLTHLLWILSTLKNVTTRSESGQNANDTNAHRLFIIWKVHPGEDFNTRW